MLAGPLLDLEHLPSIATVPWNLRIDLACEALNLGFQITLRPKDGEIA